MKKVSTYLSILLMFLGGILFLLGGCTQKSTTKKSSSTHSSRVIHKTNKKRTTTTTWHHYQQPIELPILMYHSISSGNSLRVPPEQFANEMAALKQAGYYTLSASQAVRAFKTNSLPQKKCVWITLDDGYEDNYSAALPTLEKYHLQATINYITSFQSRSGYITHSQLEQMQHTGLISFTSHTVNQLDLNELTMKEQWQELEQSKKTLDLQLNQNTQVVAYPAGRYNQLTLQLAEKSGYEIGLTTHQGLANNRQGLFALDRIRITPGLSTAQFMYLIANG
ncbi:polysaccharide deacetylase family protein [Liquorilactobacillus nagelii]|uniref:polysaccharide deacetylase family protein n=1 Tax=Liquorilactobacillus nagelii TaxID=82688 RepID=UPI00070B06E1|nr:polysaccharide deacetylase family protein [Liquorilactobacillus nagelii]